MAFEIQSITVDLMKDRATVVIADKDTGTNVHLIVKVETPGNQPENRLKDLAKDAARSALQGALAAL